MAPENMLFSLPLTDIYVNIYGHVGRRIDVSHMKLQLKRIFSLRFYASFICNVTISFKDFYC
jgi:hypothetical protein